MDELTLEIDNESSEPLYLQIYAIIRDMITVGELSVGDRLPSTRILANNQGVSRATVALAYEQLISEGYVNARRGSGNYVNAIAMLHQNIPKIYSDVDDRADFEKEDIIYDFSPVAVDLRYFPYRVWKKITCEVLDSIADNGLSKGDGKGDIELRRTISEYLKVSRGVECDPNHIVVGAGNDHLLLILQLVIGRNINIGFEEMTYTKAYKVFANNGYNTSIIRSDEYGMNADSLNDSEANIVYLMPSHQYPSGVVMPISRRMELLSWASGGESRYIIEDDYDSEFRHRGRPIPALSAHDRGGRVIYLGTFSKSIAPAIRISYMVLPDTLINSYILQASFMSNGVPRLEQRVLSEFIKNGAFTRYLNKMRTVYRKKLELMLMLLEPLSDRFDIYGEDTGLHILMKSLYDIDEEVYIRLAKNKGIRIYGLGMYRINCASEKYNGDVLKSSTIILGYGGLSEREIENGVKSLIEAINNC